MPKFLVLGLLYVSNSNERFEGHIQIIQCTHISNPILPVACDGSDSRYQEGSVVPSTASGVIFGCIVSGTAPSTRVFFRGRLVSDGFKAT